MRSKNTTKQSLLSAGAQEFADVGYQQARIVEICKNAETNPASINYYFGSKANFYIAVWDYLMEKADIHSKFSTKEPTSPAECREMLKQWMLEHTRSFARRNRAFRLRGILIHRELLNPSEMFETICDKYLFPRFRHIEKLIAGMNGEEPNTVDSRVRILAVVANVIFHMNQGALERYYVKSDSFQEDNLDKIIETSLNMLCGK